MLRIDVPCWNSNERVAQSKIIDALEEEASLLK